MSAKTFGILAILALGMFLFLHFGVEKPHEAETKAKEEAAKIFSSDFESLEKIQLRAPKKDPILLEKKDGRWIRKGTPDDLASEGQVSSLKSAMERLKSDERILEGAEFEARKGALDQYGLTDAAFRIELTEEGSPQPKVFLLGDAIGGGIRFYGKWENEPVVHTVSNDLDFYRRQGPEDFREKRLVTVEDSKVLKVEIQSRAQNPILLERANSKEAWQMTKPFTLPVDQEFVRNRVSKMVLVRANSFLDARHPSLRDPEYRVKLIFEEGVQDQRSAVGDKLPNGVELGLSRQARKGVKNPGPDDYEYYGMSDKTQAASIARFHYDNLNHKAEDYIQKSFDDFTVDQVVEVAVYENEGLTQTWKRNEAGKFEITLAKDQSKKMAEDISAQIALQSLRNLKPENFVDTRAWKTPAFRVALTLKDAHFREFAFQDLQKDGDLWWTLKDQKLRYRLKAKAIDPSLWSIEKLTSLPVPASKTEGSSAPQKSTDESDEDLHHGHSH